jgi:hypothetical protein
MEGWSAGAMQERKEKKYGEQGERERNTRYQRNGFASEEVERLREKRSWMNVVM